MHNLSLAAESLCATLKTRSQAPPQGLGHGCAREHRRCPVGEDSDPQNRLC